MLWWGVRTDLIGVQMPETTEKTTITKEELHALAEEMATRVQEYIVVHAKEGVVHTLEDNKVVFDEGNPPQNLVVRYEMVFATADLRNILKEHRAGRVKPLSMPASTEPVYE